MAGAPASLDHGGFSANFGDLMAQRVVGAAEIDLAAGRVVHLNDTLAELLGCAAEDQEARQLLLLAGPDRDGCTPQVEAELKTVQHGFVPVRLARIPLANARTLLLVAPAGRDTVDRRAAETYREIYETVSEGIYRSSIDGRQLTANPALVRLNGYESEAELLAAVRDIATEWYVEPGRRAEFQQLLHANGKVEDFVSEIYRHRTRERIWISENARLVRDRQTGSPLYYEGTIRDVTETMRRLQAEERLCIVVETIADGVITTDASGNIQSANRAAGEMFGLSPDTLVGRPLGGLIGNSRGSGAPELGTQRVAGAHADGRSFPVDLTVAEAQCPSGTMFVCYLRDVTERLRTEAGLQQAKEAAERAAHTKADFLAVMSHELRTPLNAVIGLAGLLLEGALDASARRHATMLHDAADHLLSVVNDVLDFSKLDADRLTFESIVFDLPALLEATLALMAPRAHAKGLELCADLGAALPNRVQGDPARLRQVVINLLSNAIKFTEHGSVLLEADCVRNDGALELSVTVRDTGIGIAPEQMPLLFSAFSQADSSVARRFGGTGLGLAICARLVAGMEGQIGADSAPGQGSTFRFTVRLRPASDEGRAVAPAHRLDGAHVLVVADDPLSRRIFVRQLEQRGALPLAVADGTAARAALASGSHFAAALIDHAMPGGDGASLGRNIRAMAGRARLRLVLATSSLERDRAGLGDGTFDAILPKPVQVDALVRAIRAAPPHEPEAAPAPSGSLAADQPLRILLAEDNAANQAVFRAMLERLGHCVDIVSTGLAALAALSTKTYEVVLMDVSMPELDGVAATRQLRALPGPSAAAAVIGLTAHVAQEDHAVFRAAGMDLVLTKPVTVKALGEALRSVMAQTALAG
jgi:PAS domain S-box-containing protein